jgi:hypothetical protein
MKYRKLTLRESFPIAYQKGLKKIQSENFVNNALTNGTFEKGYEKFPMQINLDSDLPLLLEVNPPHFLIGIYFKNHWRVILTSFVLGGLIWYGIDTQLKRTKQKRKPQIN